MFTSLFCFVYGCVCLFGWFLFVLLVICCCFVEFVSLLCLFVFCCFDGVCVVDLVACVCFVCWFDCLVAYCLLRSV